MITEIAPAKINLYLHVGALRRDRLHDLESVFVFADAGDVISAAPSSGLSLEIAGPFAGALTREPVDKNLVMRAARLLKEKAGVDRGARLILDKRLPIASGVGGGSADAAAALRALMRLWRVDMPVSELKRLAFTLGADVPACLDQSPVHVSGAGEAVEKGPVLPPLWVCLVNPNAPMPTGPIFRAFDAANPAPPCPERRAPAGRRYFDVTWLMENSRNDLQPIAIRRNCVIQDAIDRLSRRPGALAARMSGSGATVFGLYSSAGAAARAAQEMAGRHWWSMSARIHGASGGSPGVVC
ncbi:MAG: 4-(cytidine 5'-diphospho)-2-C-methyl-D-erythritol kinase [Pseudomonadota bacterium]